MADDILGVGKAADAISKPLQEFLNKLLGPAAEEAGELFADRVRYLRWKNSLHIVKQAHKLLEARGVTPQHIPLKTLVPILEGASLEEDRNLKNKWTNLIANAASGETVSARHAGILNRLTSFDALFLDALVETRDDFEKLRPYYDKEMPFEKYEELKECSIGSSLPFLVAEEEEWPPEVMVLDSFDTLKILRRYILDYKQTMINESDMQESVFVLKEDMNLIGYHHYVSGNFSTQIFVFTALGKAFMKAVR